MASLVSRDEPRLPSQECEDLLRRIAGRSEALVEFAELSLLSRKLNRGLPLFPADCNFTELFEQAFIQFFILWRLEEIALSAFSAGHGLPEGLRIRLAMVHAFRILHIITSRPLDLTVVNQSLEVWMGERTAPSFEGVASLLPSQLRRNSIDRFLQAVAIVITHSENLKEDTVESLRTSLMPILLLAMDQYRRPDPFWTRGASGGGDLRTMLIERIAPELLDTASNEDRSLKVRASLQTLLREPSNSIAKEQLIGILGIDPVPPELAPDLREAILSDALYPLSSLEVLMLLAVWSADLVMNDLQVSAWFEERIVSLALGGGAPIFEIEAAVRRFSRYSRGMTPLQMYRKLLTRIVDTSPELAEQLIPVLMATALRTSAIYAGEIWVLVVRFRAIARRLSPRGAEPADSA